MNLSQQVARFERIYGGLFPVVVDKSEQTAFVYERVFKTQRSVSEALVLVLGADGDKITDLITLETALAIACWNGERMFGKPQGQIIEEVSVCYKDVSWSLPKGGIDTIDSRIANDVFWDTLKAIQLQLESLISELSRESVTRSSIPYMTVREYLLAKVNVSVLVVPK